MTLDDIWHHLERGLIFRRIAFLVGLWMTVDMWRIVGAKMMQTSDPAMVAALAAAMTPLALLSGGLLKIYADHRSD